MKIDLTLSAAENCPSFDKCQCNRCPLHKDYSKLRDFDSDKKLFGWRKCRATKPTRKKIGIAFKLKHLGLTDREFSGYQKWANMSESEREAKKQKLRENSPFLRLKQKGYGIVRVGKDTSDLTLPNEIETPISSTETSDEKKADNFLRRELRLEREAEDETS